MVTRALPPLVAPRLPLERTVKRRLKTVAPGPSEHAIQAAFIHWVRAASGTIPELRLLFAVPNGGHRHARTAATLQSEGVIPGIPDILLPVARGGWVGMAFEFKSAKGSLSTAQSDYIARLTAENWLVMVCKDTEGAIAAATNYLRLARSAVNHR